MPERITVTTIEARIVLVNEVFSGTSYRDEGRGHYSEAIAKALHSNTWRSWYHPENNPLKPEDIINDSQKCQLFVERVDQTIGDLKDYEQARVISRFGIDTGEIKRWKEVGDTFGRSSERARQIIAKALRKLRHPSRSNLFKEFLPE